MTDQAVEAMVTIKIAIPQRIGTPQRDRGTVTEDPQEDLGPGIGHTTIEFPTTTRTDMEEAG